jgi:hypothetical protein
MDLLFHVSEELKKSMIIISRNYFNDNLMFDRIADGIDCDKGSFDDFDSANSQHLIDLGCKNIALLSQ